MDRSHLIFLQRQLIRDFGGLSVTCGEVSFAFCAKVIGIIDSGETVRSQGTLIMREVIWRRRYSQIVLAWEGDSRPQSHNS